MANFSDTVVYLVVHSPVGPINDVKNEAITFLLIVREINILKCY